MKNLLAIALLIFGFCASAADQEKIIKTGQTVGSFDSYTWGDYGHIQIKSNGKSVSFFASGGPTSVFEEFSKELKNVQIKVSWETAIVNSPYAGGEIEMTRTTDICSFKPITYQSKIIKEKVSLCK